MSGGVGLGSFDDIETERKEAMTEGGPMNVQIMGPNLRTEGETIHVHAVGCADLKKRLYRGTERDQYPWIEEGVTSRQEIVQRVYPPDEFEYDPETEMGVYESDVKIFDCVAKRLGA